MASLTKEWISLPLDFNQDDSFANDLLEQFDRKRTSLCQDSHIELEEPSSPPTAIIQAESSNYRRSSAAARLRRSSAYFKSTLDQTWKTLAREQPIALSIQTTIHFPSRKSSMPYPSLSPPNISAYPPKPLLYAQVDPSFQQPTKKTLLHRLSMPVLRHRP